MEALKDQMDFMMEAMLSMKRMMESNAAAVAATRAAAKADPTHPSATN